MTAINANPHSSKAWFPHADHTGALNPTRHRTAWVTLTVLFGCLAIVSRVGMIAWPFLNDSGLYAQLGRTVAGGGVLYRDFYETKFPGSALLASAFWRSFGSHWAGYVVCELVLAMLAAAALVRIARRHFPVGSAMPVLLFAIVFLNLSQAVYTGFQLETIQAFFEAVAAMAAFESLCNDDALATFAAGLAAATAAMAKPGGLGVAIALFIMLIFHGKRRKLNLLILAAGVAIPIAVTAIFTYRTGARPYLPGAMRDIANYAGGTPVDLSVILKLAMVAAILGWPFVARFVARKPAMGETRMMRAAMVIRAAMVKRAAMIRGLVIIWFAADLATILLQRRLYPYHFLPLACPAALLYGLLPRRANPATVLLGLLPIALLSLTWEGSDIRQIHRGVEQLRVSDYIASHTTPNDCVFADQIGRFLIETDRKPGSRFGTFFYLVNDDDAPARFTRTLLEDFENRKPTYLLLAQGWDVKIPGLANCDILLHCPHRRENFINAWASLRDYVAARYHLETTIDGNCVYRRNPV
jgi:hypothetical protein